MNENRFKNNDLKGEVADRGGRFRDLILSDNSSF